MSATTTVRAIPRVIITGYLNAARLPLTAVQRVVSQQHNETWPPALAFASVEAKLDTVIGTALRDEALIAKGSLQSERVAQLRKAATLDTVAELKQAEAAQQREHREAQIAEQREEAERRAKQSKNDIERQAERHEQKVREKAVKKTATARQVKESQDKAIDRQERAAKSKALTAEARALKVAKEAVDVREAVNDTDTEIAASKAARNGR